MLTVEDRIELAELVARYNQAIDHLDAAAWAATFTAGGTLIVNGAERARGEAELTTYVARRQTSGDPPRRHWSTNLLIDETDTGARLLLYVMAFDIGRALGAPYVMGEYEDDVVRTPSGWRFAIRRMIVVAGASATGR